MEEVGRAREPALGEVVIEHRPRDGELVIVPRPRTRRGVARRVDLPRLEDDRAGHVGGAPVSVVELERAVGEQERPDLHAHVPREREDRRRHLRRCVGLREPVLRADRIGDAVEDGVRDHTRARRRWSLIGRPRPRAVEREHGSRHLGGKVGVCPAILHADRVGDVGEHRLVDGPHCHQNSTSERSSSAAICCATYSLVA